MSDALKLDRRHLFRAIAAALIIAVLLGGAIQIVLPYQRGAISLYGYAYQWNSMAGLPTMKSNSRLVPSAKPVIDLPG